MPRHDYTPTRRLVMQAVMMLVLGLSIALAAVVGASARRANRVELSPEPQTSRGVSFRLPLGWGMRMQDHEGPGIIARAMESRGGEVGGDEQGDRVLWIIISRLDLPASPLQHALTHLDFRPSDEREHTTAIDESIETFPMAGQVGVMMTMEHAPRGRGRSRARTRARGNSRKEVVASVVLPSQRAVTVRLEGRGEADHSDRAVVRQVAGSIALDDEPQLGMSGEAVTLADGIRFAAPKRFAPVAQTDENRTDRHLWPANTSTPKKVETLEAGWMTISVVGCLCPDFTAADPAQVDHARSTLATLLLVRDTRWRGATIAPAGDQVWRADPPAGDAGGDAAFPARAYLMTHPSGRALLAVMHGGYGQDDYDSAWKELAATVEFLPASDVASLEDVGTAEGSRLRREGYEKLLADRDVQWWLWTRDDAHIGWSTVDFASPAASKGLKGKYQARLGLHRGADEVYQIRLTHDFEYSDQGRLYTSTIARSQSAGAVDARVETSQETTLEGQQLSQSFKRTATPTSQWTLAAAPPQFVPGALLPLLMHRLSSDPMILVTDSFPGHETRGTPLPLTVIIRPGKEAPSTRASRTPLRTLTAQVNGTGAVSRWSFSPTGEIESVEWPGGVRQLASDEVAVRNYFPKDPALPR